MRYILLRLDAEDAIDPPTMLLHVSIKSSSTCCFPSWRDVISSKSLQSTTTRIRYRIYRTLYGVKASNKFLHFPHSITNHILFPSQNQTRYSAITYRIIEMVGCQKSKCSSSWPPITTFTCIVNIQTFISAFTQTHSKPTIKTSKRHKYYYASCKKTLAVADFSYI